MSAVSWPVVEGCVRGYDLARGGLSILEHKSRSAYATVEKVRSLIDTFDVIGFIWDSINLGCTLENKYQLVSALSSQSDFVAFAITLISGVAFFAISYGSVKFLNKRCNNQEEIGRMNKEMGGGS